MIHSNRPFLVIPKLIEQPTWGGTYIGEAKGLVDDGYKNIKIGQSYELFSGTKLSLATDSGSPDFKPELGNPDSDETVHGNQLFYDGDSHINLSDLLTENPETVVGPSIWNTYHCMPLLVKFTQSLGNSFQLHVKPGVPDPHWKPKPESWYYFEDGLITYGVRKGVDLDKYKAACKKIHEHMISLSLQVVSGSLELEAARKQAKEFIASINPWQFVNTHEITKNSIVDLSAGGLHHSWEEDFEKYPLGNVVYEVQQDVMDPVSTIRCFDQGKIKNDGSIRAIQIEEYFRFVDTSDERNDISFARKERHGDTILTTSYYSLDESTISEPKTITIANSFEHIFVRTGKASIKTADHTLIVTQGHAAFIPYSVEEYTIEPDGHATVLRTYI